MKRPALIGMAAAIVALACGDLPTLPDGIAYVSRISLPSPAIAAGDSLRDSTGKVARLSVPAFDVNGKPVANTPAYTVITLGPSLQVSADGIVTAADTIRPASIVARIGERLQTTPETLFVVPQPDTITPVVASTPPATDTLTGQSGALQVTVSGPRGTARIPVRGVVVRYAISRVYRSTGAVNAAPSIDSTNFFLLDDLLRPRTSNQLVLPDTTNESGQASRVLLVPVAAGIDSVEVLARANNLRAVPLRGSPIRFIVKVRR